MILKEEETKFILRESTMMIRKTTGAPVLVAVLAMFVLVESPSHAREVYRWVDEKGTIHFSEEESSVPEEYREKLEKKSLPDEAKQPEEKVKIKRQDPKVAKDGTSPREIEKVNKSKIEDDVIESIKTILSLWKDGKYRVLYDHGNRKSRVAVNREDFERRMTKKGIGLASSWETLRDIQVDIKRATLAYATITIGLKPIRGGETRFRTETYRMSLENGMWKIDLAKILSAKI